MANLLRHRQPLPIRFILALVPWCRAPDPDKFDSACLKPVKAAGGDWHDDGQQTSKPAVLITRPSAAPRWVDWNMSCFPLQLFTFCCFLPFSSSFCSSISFWSSQKVTVADSRYDLLMRSWGKIPPGPQNHIKRWLVGLQLRPVDILFAQAWANIS